MKRDRKLKKILHFSHFFSFSLQLTKTLFSSLLKKKNKNIRGGDKIKKKEKRRRDSYKRVRYWRRK